MQDFPVLGKSGPQGPKIYGFRGANFFKKKNSPERMQSVYSGGKSALFVATRRTFYCCIVITHALRASHDRPVVLSDRRMAHWRLLAWPLSRSVDFESVVPYVSPMSHSDLFIL